MSDLLSALMEYADSTFRPSPAYWEALECLTTRQEALEATLTQRQRDLLEAFLDAQHTLHSIDAEGVLCAGIAMGQELCTLTSLRKPPRTRCR